MQVIKITYNENTDTTKVVFNQNYEQSDYVTKLDLLRDTISSLQEEYNNILKKG